ncbi:MAG: DUF4174 domain-containing protein [Candidatus Phaeomarinobacter sp.]
MRCFPKALLVATALLVPTPLLAQLETLGSTYRPMVIVAPSSNDPVLEDIRITLRQSRNALADRDVIVLTVTEDDVSIWDPALEAVPNQVFDPDRLREVYGSAGQAVSITLVGKDGGIKDRGTAPGDIQDMLDLIDTMPMRQRELEARAREAERREEIENRMWGGETFGR